MKLIPNFVKRRIAHRPNLVKIVDNLGWLFIDKIIRMSIGLFVGVWVARYLGPEQFGLLNFALAFCGIFAGFATLGLQEVAVRDVIRNPRCAGETLGSAAALQLVGGWVAYLLILVVIAYLRPDDTITRTIVAILGSIMLLEASKVGVFWFESQLMSKYTVWVQTSVFLVFASIKIILILRQASVTVFAWATLAEAVVVATVLLGVMSKLGPTLTKLSVSAARVKSLINESWPLMLSGMVLMVQARIDQIMLGQMVGEIEVGYYSVALRVIEMTTIFSIILHSTFAPSIINSKKISEKSYLKKLEAFYKLNFIVAIFLAVPLACFSPWIISYLFGDRYMPAATIMSIMSIRLVLTHIGVARSIYLINENLLKYSLFTMIMGTIVNIILNYLLIPSYLGVGAAIVSLVSFFVTNFCIDLIYNKTRSNAIMIAKSTITCFTLLRKNSWEL